MLSTLSASLMLSTGEDERKKKMEREKEREGEGERKSEWIQHSQTNIVRQSGGGVL